MADSTSVTGLLAGAVSMGWGRRNRALPVPETALPATDLDLISFLMAIPDARMWRGIRIPAWYLLLVAVLGILSRCQSVRDLEHFAIRHHSVLTEALGIDLRRPPFDSAYRNFFRQVDVAALCAAIRDWTIDQIPGSAADLAQLVCDGKTLRGSITVLGESGRMPDRFIGAEADKPTKQQVVVQLLDQHPLRADAVDRLQQQCQQQLLGRDRGPAALGVKPAEGGIEPIEGLISQLADPPQRMTGRDPVLDRDVGEQ
jgi:hypothetical protein